MLYHLLKIQPEVHGEWFPVGFTNNVHVFPLSNNWHVTVYDANHPNLNVTVGFKKLFMLMNGPEAETLIEVEAFPLLETGKMYHIPDSQWIVKVI
jgi:hypothetical protein